MTQRILLNAEEHAAFLSEGRKDPITKQPLQAGMEVVLCAKEGVAFLAEYWEGQCPLCQGVETLASLPSSRFPQQLVRPHNQPSRVLQNQPPQNPITVGQRFRLHPHTVDPDQADAEQANAEQAIQRRLLRPWERLDTPEPPPTHRRRSRGRWPAIPTGVWVLLVVFFPLWWTLFRTVINPRPNFQQPVSAVATVLPSPMATRQPAKQAAKQVAKQTTAQTGVIKATAGYTVRMSLIPKFMNWAISDQVQQGAEEAAKALQNPVQLRYAGGELINYETAQVHFIKQALDMKEQAIMLNSAGLASERLFTTTLPADLTLVTWGSPFLTSQAAQLHIPLIQAGQVQNFNDIGYLTYYATYLLASGQMEAKPGVQFEAGRLGIYTIEVDANRKNLLQVVHRVS